MVEASFSSLLTFLYLLDQSKLQINISNAKRSQLLVLLSDSVKLLQYFDCSKKINNGMLGSRLTETKYQHG